MGEIDDAIRNRSDAEREREIAERFAVDHGEGWRVLAPSADLRTLIDDFVSRLSPDAGEAGYWVDRIGEPTVHLSKARSGSDRFFHVLGSFTDNWSNYYQPHAVNQERAERRDRRGDARVLKFDRYVFIRLANGGWQPAQLISGTSAFHANDRDGLLAAIVSYLGDGRR